jgi:CheY-like chemotaxis protein
MKKLNVLVVGDDKITNNLIVAILKSNDHEATCAVDGLEALEILDGKEFDLIISDGRMPNLDGYGLVLQIRRRSRLQNIRFILYTATYLSQEDERRALTSGVNKYIRKSGSIKEITDAIKDFASRETH